ncbi:HK97 family phage prohead protease [Micromonospora sp. SL1-18]|uniref:HK97 family phage prohead protease n=1 Tax=Micromonospora sp. SL1-18 TaxID=3399128 RepID=UPI003A4D858B
MQPLAVNAGTISGYAAVWLKPSVDLGGFVEQIAPGAFTDSLRTSDVRGLLNHDPNQILGRQGAGTLRLTEDATGLRYEIDLPDSPLGQTVARAVERGDLVHSSFQFRSVREDWGSLPDGTPLRTIRRAVILDVSPVAFPAYPDTYGLTVAAQATG